MRFPREGSEMVNDSGGTVVEERCTFGCTYLCGQVVVGWPALFVLFPKGVPALRFDIGA